MLSPYYYWKGIEGKMRKKDKKKNKKSNYCQKKKHNILSKKLITTIKK